MEHIILPVHSSDLVGTCDKTEGECSALDAQVRDLEERGLDDGAIDLVIKQRQERCAELGRCSLYYGEKESDNAA